MTEQALLDNDVVLKMACYTLADEALAATSQGGAPAGMLGVGRFVVRGRIERDGRIADRPRARATFEKMLETLFLFEPDEEELAMAADMEAEAQRLDLELDGGESQLLAMLVKRELSALITGDKRAIAAMAVMATVIAAQRIVCLEQLLAAILATAGLGTIRPRICAEPQVDRAVTACFSCFRQAVDEQDVSEGLFSYIGHLDRSAPGVLKPAFASGPTG
jgi:hypothetical protein